MFRRRRVGIRPFSLALIIAALVGLCSDPAEAHPDISEAEDAIAHALEASPRDHALYVQRATLQRERKDWDAAAASYIKAAELGANPDITDVGLATVLGQAGLQEAALASINVALDRNAKNGLALFTRARIHAQEDPQAAAADYALAIDNMERPVPSSVLEAMNAQLATDGSATAADAVVATGDMAAGKTDPEPDAIKRALAIADVAHSKLGVISTIQSRAVELEAQRGNYDAAIARLDTMIEQVPQHEVWNARRGDLLAEKGSEAEAAEAYRHTLALIQRRPPARRSPRLKSLESELRAKLAADPKTKQGENP